VFGDHFLFKRMVDIYLIIFSMPNQTMPGLTVALVILGVTVPILREHHRLLNI